MNICLYESSLKSSQIFLGSYCILWYFLQRTTLQFSKCHVCHIKAWLCPVSYVPPVSKMTQTHSKALWSEKLVWHGPVCSLTESLLELSCHGLADEWPPLHKKKGKNGQGSPWRINTDTWDDLLRMLKTQHCCLPCCLLHRWRTNLWEQVGGELRL